MKSMKMIKKGNMKEKASALTDFQYKCLDEREPRTHRGRK